MINFKDVKEKIKNNTVLSVIIASIALVVSSIIISKAVKSTFLIRTLTVKGAAERTVKSDFAIWKIELEEQDEDLQKTRIKVEDDLKKLKSFLKESGFKDSEISDSAFKLGETDEYVTGAKKPTKIKNYRISTAVIVKTENVDLVDKTYLNLIVLIKRGVKIKSPNYYRSTNNAPSYLFKAFKSVKDDMIKEATKNALKTAETFANDANDKIKGIKTANQGIFQITPELSDEKYADESMYIMKNIRVVTTITYILE